MKNGIDRRHFMALMGAAAATPLITRHAHAASPLTMQAAWINDAEFCGYFAAIDNGYYKDEGLDLTYLSGGPDVIPESSIIAGKADLALTTPDTTIKAIVDQGAKFKIIGAQYQKNPHRHHFAGEEPNSRAKGPDRQDFGGAARQRHFHRSHASRQWHRPRAGQHRSVLPTTRRRSSRAR